MKILKLSIYLIITILLGKMCLYYWPSQTSSSNQEETPLPQPQIAPQQQIINKLLAIHGSLDSSYQKVGITLLISSLKDPKLPFSQKLDKFNDLLTGSLINWSEKDKQELNFLIEKWKKEQPTPESVLPEIKKQILTQLDAWHKTASKSIKRLIKQTNKTFNSNSDPAEQINDLEHLLTHYGRDQVKLSSLLTKLKEVS